MKKIYLNDNFKIDLPRLLETRLLIQANSGGGKSWLIRRLLEESHGQVQQIVIDMEGEFATLREKYDYVLVGKGGDTSANVRSAPLLARRLLEMKVSAIIDLSELQHYERKRFVKLFLDSMIDAPKELWTHCLVVVDEAHQFVPEKGESEAASAVIDLCTRGRKRGFCAVLATQRLSKLHKDAAAECNNKLIGRTGLDIDMKRASEELGFTSKEQTLSLRSLDAGEFYAFGPAICSEPKRVTIGGVETSHPKVGSKILSQVVPPTDKIKSVLKQLEDLPKEAEKEAKTMQDLKNEIIGLKRENSTKEKGFTQLDIQNALEPHLTAFRSVEQGYKNTIQHWVDYVQSIMRMVVAFNFESKEFFEKKMPSKDPGVSYVPSKTIVIVPKKVHTPSYDIMASRLPGEPKMIMALGEEKTGMGEKKVLIAVAQHERVSREHLTLLTGYKRSTRDRYLQYLQAKGFVAVSNGMIEMTQDGLNHLGNDYEPLPVGEALRIKLMQTLPEGEKKILEVLMNSYPAPVDRETLSSLTGYQRSTRDRYIQYLNARQLVQYEGRGLVKANDKLF